MRHRIQATTLRTSLFAVAILSILSCAKPPMTGPYSLHPIDEMGAAAAQPDPTTIEHPGVRIEIIPIPANPELDKLGRRARGMRQLGIVRDPDSRDPYFVAFRIRLAATGERPVHVESQSIRLWLEDGRPGPAPLDYTRAYELLRPDRESGPGKEELESFMRGLLDGSVDIQPGGRHEGLLVFPSPDAESKQVLLELPFVQVGSDTHRVRVPFAKVFAQPLRSTTR